MLDWFWPDWHQDRSGVARRVEIPEAGGWMYQFRSGDAAYNHVFVPNMTTWANAIAAALDQNRPVSVALDIAHVTKTEQDVPMKGN